MKINLLLPLALVLALVPLSGSWAYHPGQISEATPEPIKKCFTGIQIYRQLFVGRAAGLTLDEALLDNNFAFRVLKYIAENTEKKFDDVMEHDLDGKTVEVYELPDPQYLDPEWQAAWATVKYDECIAEIPKELIEPPAPPPSDQLIRMIPEISI